MAAEAVWLTKTRECFGFGIGNKTLHVVSMDGEMKFVCVPAYDWMNLVMGLPDC